MVTSEHLVTLLAVVPKYSQKDWLSSYESLDTFVVSICSFIVTWLVIDCHFNYLYDFRPFSKLLILLL